MSALTIKKFLRVATPSLDNNVGDAERVNIALGENFDTKNIIWPLDLLRDIARILRTNGGDITATLFTDGDTIKIINIESGNTADSHFGIAVDIGTTVVAAELVDLHKGKSLAAAGDINGQVVYGEDLLTRLHFSSQGGLSKLHQTLLDTINGLIAKVCDIANIDVNQVSAICAAGNTSMTHLLLGLDPSPIRREPYAPVLAKVPMFAAKDLGLNIMPNAAVYIFPSVGSFLGGDLVAGALSAGIDERDEISLLLDIGTNGEMILGNNEWLLAGAGAAGPALEGGVAECAKRAEPGAIDRVNIDKATLEPSYSVIGDIEPTGLCGSGLIDAIAALYNAGLLDTTGHFILEKNTDRWQLINNKPAYIIRYADKTRGIPLIYISEKDIQNVMRTKAAMVAALTILLDSVGLDINSIDRVYTAGSFGIHLSIESSKAIGLYPKLPTERFVQLGNGSLKGAKEVLLNAGKINDANRIAEKITYLELNIHPAFMSIFRSAKYLDGGH
ncbi:MAG: ASKHA domain-containing protein [Firmicutes bacterium]|nr:ASKHA domain-containing protein [Bacillota bacterium]